MPDVQRAADWLDLHFQSSGRFAAAAEVQRQDREMMGVATLMAKYAEARNAELEGLLRETQPYVRDTLSKLSMPSQHFEIAKVRTLLTTIDKALSYSSETPDDR